MRPSVLILTYNSEGSLPGTLESVQDLTDDIVVVDSGSTDRTVAIAESAGARVLHHPFENYGSQRNWTIDHAEPRYEWQLHLDADEQLTPELRQEIALLAENVAVDGFYVPRLMRFLGRILRYGDMSPTWHMRLFRKGAGRCENREYDQHFLCLGSRTQQLRGRMIDDVRMSLSEWTARHNRWADAEVREVLQGLHEDRVRGNLRGTVVERKRALRSFYSSSAPFLRPFLLFFYRYVVRLGFLDGIEGFIYYTLQTFWFRFLVDAKIWEAKHAAREL